mmetsp:Transcript_47272/g.137603  ORF Transcript_47272/g.137603 Transcript_47272/m.137603 type:complete len:756 (+) Transcript_47272:111-2378(+)
MELKDIGEAFNVGARRLLYRVSETVIQPQAQPSLGLLVGDEVFVWSNLKGKWIEDGMVQERTDTEKCVNGARLPAGSLKIVAEGGSLVQWVLPTEVREFLRKVPRAKPSDFVCGGSSSMSDYFLCQRPSRRASSSEVVGAEGMLEHLRLVQQECALSGRPFVDPTFRLETTHRVSQWLRPREVDRHEGKRLCPEPDIRWTFCGPTAVSRPKQPPDVDWQLFRGLPRSDDVQQGELGDCWLLSSLACLAEFQEGRFVRALLPGQEHFNELGAYMVRLCVGGMWTGILVDDRMPSMGGGFFYTQFAYCQTNRLQVWASLIEKAFAKVCGSYDALKGGEAAEALELFTGWPSQLYIHSWPEFDPELLWATLSSSRDFEFLMVCSTKRVWAVGLESDHVYSLMDVHEINYPGRGLVRLLKIRNPNSKSKWQGDWSDSSALWTEQLRNKLGCPKEGTPHIFFMCYDDFLKHFAHCTICKIRSNDWFELRQQVLLPPHQVPYEALIIDVFDTTEISLSLEQPSHRLRGGPLFPHLPGPPANMGFVLLRSDKSVVNVLASASVNRKAIVSAECWLEPGRYMAVPLSYHVGQPLMATWACFSSRRVRMASRQLTKEEVRTAWVAYVLDRDPAGTDFHGGVLHLGKGPGGCTVAFAQNPPSSGMYFNVQLLFKSGSLHYSRGAPTTSDWLAPGQAQILNFAQPNDTCTGDVSWWTNHTFQMTQAKPQGSSHEPTIRPGDYLHMPFSLNELRSRAVCAGGPCAVQ